MDGLRILPHRLNGDVVERRHGPAPALARILEEADAVLIGSGVRTREIAAIGRCSPGFVSIRRGS